MTHLPPSRETPRDEAHREPRDKSRNEDIVIECDLPEPPEKVWRALTVPELLRAWLLGADLRPAGDRNAERGDPRADTRSDTQRDSLEPLSVEPQQRVQYRWSAREESGARERQFDSQLSFELTPAAGGGTHLRIVHGDFRTSPVIRMSAVRKPVGTRSCAPLMQASLRWAA